MLMLGFANIPTLQVRNYLRRKDLRRRISPQILKFAKQMLSEAVTGVR